MCLVLVAVLACTIATGILGDNLVVASDGTAPRSSAALSRAYPHEIHEELGLTASARVVDDGVTLEGTAIGDLWTPRDLACPSVDTVRDEGGVRLVGVGTKPAGNSCYQTGLDLLWNFTAKQAFEVVATVTIHRLAEVFAIQVSSLNAAYHVDFYCTEDGYALCWNHLCDLGLPGCSQSGWDFRPLNSQETTHTLRLTYSGDQERILLAYADEENVGMAVLPAPLGRVGLSFFAQSGFHSIGLIDCTIRDFHLGWE